MWDTRNFGQKLGAGLGAGMQDFAKVLMILQGQKREDAIRNQNMAREDAANAQAQSNWFDAYNLRKQGQEFDQKMAQQQFFERMRERLTQPQPQPQYDPMVGLKLEHQQLLNEQLKNNIADSKASSKGGVSPEDARRKTFNELYSPTTGEVPTQGLLDSAQTYINTGQYPPQPPEGRGFFERLLRSVGLSSAEQPNPSQQPAVLKPPQQLGNLFGKDENRTHAQSLMNEGASVNDVDWEAFKKDFPNADIEAIKGYMSGKLR